MPGRHQRVVAADRLGEVARPTAGPAPGSARGRFGVGSRGRVGRPTAGAGRRERVGRVRSGGCRWRPGARGWPDRRRLADGRRWAGRWRRPSAEAGLGDRAVLSEQPPGPTVLDHTADGRRIRRPAASARAADAAPPSESWVAVGPRPAPARGRLAGAGRGSRLAARRRRPPRRRPVAPAPTGSARRAGAPPRSSTAGPPDRRESICLQQRGQRAGPLRWRELPGGHLVQQGDRVRVGAERAERPPGRRRASSPGRRRPRRRWPRRRGPPRAPGRPGCRAPGRWRSGWRRRARARCRSR